MYPSQIGPPADAAAQPPPASSRPLVLRRADAPLVLPSRDARPQLRQSGRSAVREVSSRKDEDRKGWQGAGPELSRKERHHADHEG